MEGLHHRHHDNSNGNNKTAPLASNSTIDTSSNGKQKSDNNPSSPSTNNPPSSSLNYLLLPILPFLILYILPNASPFSLPKKVRLAIYYTLSLPFLSMLYITISPEYPLQQRLIAASFVASTVLNQIPHKVFFCGFVAASVLLWFGLSSRPLNTSSSSTTTQSNKKNDDDDDETTASSDQQQQSPQNKIQTLLKDGKVRATLAAFFVIIALLFENFLIWVVAASYKVAHNSFPTPLQDNGRIVLENLANLASLSKQDLQNIRDVLNVPWSLVSALATSFICVELHIGNAHSQKRSLWGVALRGLTALAYARTIRAISLTLTVLPSQIPYCYSKKFPNPPPSDWYSWIMVGLRPLSHGGCNDLIVSGHATITSLFACISASISGNECFSVAVWFLLSVDFGVEMYQGLHYSVDMFLGGVIMALLWKCMAYLEIDSHIGKHTSFLPIKDTTVKDGVMYAAPIYLAWLVLMFGSSFVANGSIYIYLVMSVVVAVESGGYTHYVQHLLLCILYVALAVYL